jgi:hypothetical protein
MLDMELPMSCALMVLLHVRLGVSAAPLMEDAYPPELSTAIPSVYPPRPGFPEARSRILPPPALILMAK